MQGSGKGGVDRESAERGKGPVEVEGHGGGRGEEEELGEVVAGSGGGVVRQDDVRELGWVGWDGIK